VARESSNFFQVSISDVANKSLRCSTWFESLALAGSALLKQRNREMNATAAVMGVPLKSMAVEV